MKVDATLLARIHDGQQLIVAQPQQSQSIKKQYHRWLEQQQISLFETPRIYDWQSWINQCWHEHSSASNDSRVVLNRLQQRLLWEQVIANSSRAGTATVLWNQHASVNTAIAAWSMIKDYQLDLDDNTYPSEDNRVFMRWYEQYQHHLTMKQWLDPKQLIELMMAQSIKPVCTAPCLFLLSQSTPLQQQWLDHIQHSGNSIELIKFQNLKLNPELPINQYSDFDQEVYAALCWAIDRLDEQPETQVCLVVAELVQVQYRLQSLLNLVFQRRQSWLEYKLSTQADLGSSELIKSALTSLEMLAHDFEYEIFSNFLRNPYFQNQTSDRHANALLDIQLRQDCKQKISLATLLRRLERMDTNIDAKLILIERIKKLQTFITKQPRYNSAAKWCEIFSSVLQILNWPNRCKLNQAEVQDLQSWDQLLADLCAATLVKSSLSFAQALVLLRQYASSTLRKNNSRLQIVDLNQAQSISASHVWVIGLSDKVLPESVRLNPLIPYSLQRNQSLPRSNAALCIDQALLLLTNLIQTNNQCVLSFHVKHEDNEHLVSALLASNPLIIVPDKPLSLFDSEKTVLECFADDFGSPIGGKKVHGGTYLIKDQAACPFQAYAKHRLDAQPFEYQEEGIDAKEKGRVVHLVLQKIWQQLVDHKTLLALSDEALESLIIKTVDKVIHTLDKSQQLFIEVERSRLQQIINSWLSMEKLRPAFRVTEQESELSFSVSGLELKIKPDRIDLLDSGERLLIDYKTGKASSNNWLGKRLLDPQLPIYRLAFNNAVSAITFALISDCKFDGVSESDTQLKGIKQTGKYKQGPIKDYDDWQQLQQHWQSGIEQLVSEYKRGYARVEPANPSVECQYCGRASLCRIDQDYNDANNEQPD